MKILMLSNRFPPDIAGGAEILAGDLAVALRQRGHEVRVLTSACDNRGTVREPWIERRLRPVVDGPRARDGSRRRGPGRIVAFYRETHSRSSARTVRRVIAQSAPDIVYVWNISGVGLVSILRALQQVRIPIVFHLHSYWWQYINSPETRFSTVRMAWLKKLIIGPVPPLKFSTLIATSEAVKHEYTRAGCPGDRIEVIDNAIDGRFLEGDFPARRVRQPSVLMYAGRLTAEKGVMVALEAVDLLVNRDRRQVRLEVFGSGDPHYQFELEAFVRSHGLSKVVIFNGLVDQDRLIRAYDGADLVVVPSLWAEPFGLVAVEAMARGVAVIASDVGGLSGVLRDHVDGRLVMPGDPEVLAAAIADSLDQPDERRRLGSAAQETVRERFTLDICSRRVERHLNGALGVDAQESRWSG